MSYVEYEKAQKLALKAYKTAISKGQSEYLPVLDEILENVDILSEVNLGLIQIPLERVVGTSSRGRTTAFANNFMPLLDYKTEFGAKWSNLCDSQLEEGIREPIKVYEYLNYFYVIEGNKRVSVMKYFDAVSIPAQVIRKVPKLTDDLKIKIYYEFMDFYKLTEINYIWFSQEGCFKRLLELTSENPNVEWTEDQKKDFGSANHNFCVALKECGGDKLPMTSGDAFLIFIDIYGYENIKYLLKNEMHEKITHLWDEFLVESKGKDIQLKMEPAKSGRKKLMDYFLSSNPKKLMVAFIFDKDPDASDWLYGHELGRLYLDEHYGDRVKTIKVHNLNSEEDTITAMEDLVKMGVNVMFTTSSKQINSSLKIAANYPEVKVLNCSINTSHKLITTYYARLYEVKFLAGMIAGAMTDNNKIGYMTDYPIIGTPANINAFALGARMVNPYAKVILKWSTIKGVSRNDVLRSFREENVHYVSDQVTIKPKEANRQYGLYYMESETTENIALPMYNWGIFYSKIIDSMLDGTFKYEVTNSEQPVNYWWGLSAGVVDIICSKKLPDGTKRLMETIKKLITEGSFLPFSGKIVSQDGTIKNEESDSLSPEEIIKMNWLVDNVEGEIPEYKELKDEAKSIVEIKGVADETTVTG